MLKIRQGQASDADVLSQLAVQCFKDLNYNDNQLAQIESLLNFSDRHFPLYYFGVVEDPITIGFYVLHFVSQDQTELKGVYVQSSYQRQGYGKALINHAKIQTRVLGSRELIFACNNESQAFFEAVGAKPEANGALQNKSVFSTAMVLPL